MLCIHVLIGQIDVCADRLDHCPCTIDATTGTADCHGQNLTAVPDCVPVTIKSLQLIRNNFVRLHKKEFAKFTNLQEIDFGVNKLEFLNEDCFQGLSRLTVLRLWYNKLRIIQNSSLTNIPELQFLVLNFNEIRRVSEFTFINNPNLLKLFLTQNEITHISENAFAGLDKLIFLSLSKNRLYFKDSLPMKVFSPLVNLDILQISDVCSEDLRYRSNCTYFDHQLSQVPSLRQLCLGGLGNKALGNGFRSLTHLENLYLGQDPYDVIPGCEMENISSKTFESLFSTPLTSLSLITCAISSIMPHTFDPIKSLRSLDLRDNFLCEFYQSFIGLKSTSIRSLNLAGTCRRNTLFLQSRSVESLSETRLEHLDWSNSNAVSINNEEPHDFWKSLPKPLRRLYLHNNKLNARTTYIDTIAIMENLQTLDLSNQDIHWRPQDISSDWAQSRSHNTYVSDDTDEVVYEYKSNHNDTLDSLLNQTMIQRRRTCLSLPYRLRHLNISQSDLLPLFLPMFCNRNNSLKVLNISHHKPTTNITRLWGALKKFGQLEELDLRSNKIREMPPKLFINNYRLKRLWLGDNSLLTVDLDVTSLSKLELVDLSYNSIQFLTKQFLSSFNRIARHSTIKIYLQNNSFLCNCDHRDFVDWLRYTETIFEKEKLVCKYKNDSLLSLRYVADIHNSLEAECIARTVLIGCTVFFVGTTILTSLLAIIYYQRWNFNYLLGIGRRNINPYHPIEDSQIEMVYDLYISYEGDFIISDDETLHNFVAQTLYPALVNRGFKVLIREELEPGGRLYDQITSKLRRTERVIVLLTKGYCKDYWNVFEFNMAVMEGIYTRRTVIVPVVLDILNKEDLHEDVYTFLKDYTVAYVRPENLSTVLTPYLIDRLK